MSWDDDEWEFELTPVEGQFKFGYNGETMQLLAWPVSGSPDGRPFHAEMLVPAWDRHQNQELGDAVGLAQPSAPGSTAYVATVYIGTPPADAIEELRNAVGATSLEIDGGIGTSE